VTPTVQLASSTVVLTQATMNALATDTPATDDASGTLTWPAPAPTQVTSLASGAIILGPISTAAPDGLLATVTAVTSDGSGNYTVTTTTASLADAFSDISFGYSGDPLDQPGSTFQAKSAGIRNLPRNGSVKLSLGHTFSVSSGGAASVSGDINIDAEVDMSAEVHTHYAIPDGVSVSASAEVSAKANVAATLKGTKKWELGEIDSPEIDIQIGPVPVVLFPKIPVFLSVSGQISVGVTASMSVGAGMSWSSQDSGTLNTTNLTSGPHLDGSGPLPGVSATATGTVELQVQPQIEIYDLAGPNVEADADLKATVNFIGSPYFTLAPSVALKAGLDFDILDGRFHGSLEVTLGTFDFPNFVIQSAPNVTLTVSPADPTVFPGTPTTFTAAPSSGPTHPLKWYLEGAAKGDAITSGGVLTTVNPSGRTLTVVAQDSTTHALGQTTVTDGAAFDPVGDLTASQGSNSVNGEVSWSPPQNTGGSPIAHYTVTVSGGIATQTTTGTSVTLTNLHPGTTYVITVYPTNTANKTGPEATTSLEIIPTCTDTFTGGSQGNGTDWNTAANWSGDYVPGAGDWVCVNGNVSLSTSTTIQGLQLSGVLTLPSNDVLTVATGLTVLQGTFTDGGTVVLPSGTTTTVDDSDFCVCGPFSLLSGDTTLVNRGSLTVAAENYYSSNTIDTGSVFENAGTVSVQDTTEIGGGGLLLNDAGATITYVGPPGENASIDVPMQDNGAVDVGDAQPPHLRPRLRLHADGGSEHDTRRAVGVGSSDTQGNPGHRRPGGIQARHRHPGHGPDGQFGLGHLRHGDRHQVHRRPLARLLHRHRRGPDGD
jgi:hypothetical protein